MATASRGPWNFRPERNHSDGWFDHTGDCAWCGAPTELPRPGYELPESNCRHGDIEVTGSVASCAGVARKCRDGEVAPNKAEEE